MSPISIVILSHNRLEDLSGNLQQLLSEMSSLDEFEIVIVDNNSTDGSQEFLMELQKKCPEIELVLNNTNLGVAGGRNSGFAIAKRDFVAAFDDDAKISCEDLRRIPALFEKFPTAGLFAFRVLHFVSKCAQNPHGDTICQVANHHGAGFAFRKCAYETIGGIDEECDFGGEELDFAIRVYSHGWQVLFIPELTVYHNNFRRNIDVDKFRRTRRVYNNVRIYFKYFPKWMAFRNGSRYLILSIRTWVLNYGVSGLVDLLGAALQGCNAGIANFQSIPNEVVAFYNNPMLRPEFGNVPIMYKIVSYLRKLLLGKRKTWQK